ncbi:MAG: esterase-like activity of phytase family protein [Polaribacter sp.]|nr:esterase-like activity of phytase family protein [Polaribacter sp.]
MLTFLFSCNNKKDLELHFLDEYVVEDSLLVKTTLVGGLSGIDYEDGNYFFVVDDPKKPRFLKAKIVLQKNKIISVDYENMTILNDSTSSYYKENVLDLESIFIDKETKEINFVSEGSINSGKSPSIFSTDKNGKLIHVYELPKSLKNNQTFKHNAVFEGSSKSTDHRGFWVSVEGPLKIDGEDPRFIKTSSPIRITYFNKTTKKAIKQFAYQLEHIIRPSKGDVNLNGVTALVEYKENHFLIVERTYQSGYGSYGNIVKIFEASIDKTTTNILEIDSLRKTKYIPLRKRLLFNFDTIKNKLTNGIIDNIEGITLGPILANGNQSVLLVSDNNFQTYGRQLNQFILLEISTK